MNLSSLVTWLEGKKTYIISVLTAADGLWQYYVQHQGDWRALANYLLIGGGLAALRAGISKAGAAK